MFIAALNLLKQMLLFDAALRIDGDDALAHPYFVSYSNPNDEPLCTKPFHIEDELDEYCTKDLQVFTIQSFDYIHIMSFSLEHQTP